MATADQVAEVRNNTDEPTDDQYDNPRIAALIDLLGVNRASATIWREKAAGYAKQVNVSEAGSSVALGDLQKKALDMATLYDGLAGSFSTRVHTIVRD